MYYHGFQKMETETEKIRLPRRDKASLATQGEPKYTTRNARAIQAEKRQIQLLPCRVNRVSRPDPAR
jgi:hypothetical protein